MAGGLTAGACGGAHRLELGDPTEAAACLDAVRYAVGCTDLTGPVQLVAGAWALTLPELRAIRELLAARALPLESVESCCATTLVAAAALALPIHPRNAPAAPPPPAASGRALTIQRGPLRAGEHLQVDGSVLLLGDVNPGARITAGGHVLVWGRLRGIAHAGCQGDRQARIVALQLRPVQLRIADVVARGPAAIPPPGLSEEAHLQGDAIEIDPARPHWPLDD